ncbi:MAG: hypothetical protein ACFFDN_27835 [Candidatus Hodarchaeota archaeon]
MPNNTKLKASDQKGRWVKVIYWIDNKDMSKGCYIGWTTKDFLECLDK